MSIQNRSVTIDAHQHFIDSRRFSYPWIGEDMKALRRNYLPLDLRPEMDRVGVDASVFVQACHDVEEIDWALQLAGENPWIAGIVGWLDLTSPALRERIEQFQSNPRFVGVRHVVHDEPDERWLLRDNVVEGLETLAKCNVTYDLLLRPQHLAHIPQLAKRLPHLRMVIDHLAKPSIRLGHLEPWRSDLAEVAKFPNIFCKISGIITEANNQAWRAIDLYPYIETALELFGPERLMFGSDWPVCRLAGEYSDVFAATQQAFANLSCDERAAIFGETAIRFYRLAL
jgi:L-fuconolactonase